MCEFLKLYRICFVYGLYQLIKIFFIESIVQSRDMVEFYCIIVGNEDI